MAVVYTVNGRSKLWPMRLLTVISIASLVASIAAVVLVLGLYAELDKSEAEPPKVHTQELNEVMVRDLIGRHVSELIESAGITDDNKHGMGEAWESLPGLQCIWRQGIDADGELSIIPVAFSPFSDSSVTYNYIKVDDIWLVTFASVWFACDEPMTWVMDDNTGEVTYGHPDEKSVEN